MSALTNGGQFTEQILEIFAQCVCISVVHDYIFPIFESGHKEKNMLDLVKDYSAISIVKPTRYTISQIYFILEQQSTCFGRSFRPLSGI